MLLSSRANEVQKRLEVLLRNYVGSQGEHCGRTTRGSRVDLVKLHLGPLGLTSALRLVTTLLGQSSGEAEGARFSIPG